MLAVEVHDLGEAGEKVLDLVADAGPPELAEVGEVLANLDGGDPAADLHLGRGNGADAFFDEPAETSEIQT